MICLHASNINIFWNQRYDRLAKVITRVLNQRPVDAVDIAQHLTDEQRNSFEHKVDTLIDKPDKSTETKLALIQKSLYIVKDIRLNSIVFADFSK